MLRLPFQIEMINSRGISMLPRMCFMSRHGCHGRGLGPEGNLVCRLAMCHLMTWWYSHMINSILSSNPEGHLQIFTHIREEICW